MCQQASHCGNARAHQGGEPPADRACDPHTREATPGSQGIRGCDQTRATQDAARTRAPLGLALGSPQEPNGGSRPREASCVCVQPGGHRETRQTGTCKKAVWKEDRHGKLFWTGVCSCSGCLPVGDADLPSSTLFSKGRGGCEQRERAEEPGAAFTPQPSD